MLLNELMQADVRIICVSGVQILDENPLPVREKRDRRNRSLRRGCDPIQKILEMPGETGDGFGVEKVGVVNERRGKSIAGFRHHERKIELRWLLQKTHRFEDRAIDLDAFTRNSQRDRVQTSHAVDVSLFVNKCRFK